MGAGHVSARVTCRRGSRVGGRQLLRALEHVHAAGLAHRDVKPANLLVTAGGRAFLIDFGLAAPLRAGEGGGGEAAMEADSDREAEEGGGGAEEEECEV
jgi:hypothetical protein